jgi:hypothetical protein
MVQYATFTDADLQQGKDYYWLYVKTRNGLPFSRWLFDMFTNGVG